MQQYIDTSSKKQRICRKAIGPAACSWLQACWSISLADAASDLSMPGLMQLYYPNFVSGIHWAQVALVTRKIIVFINCMVAMANVMRRTVSSPHKINCNYVLTIPVIKSSVIRWISNFNIRNSPKATTDRRPLDQRLYIRTTGKARVRRIPQFSSCRGTSYLLTIAARRP